MFQHGSFCKKKTTKKKKTNETWLFIQTLQWQIVEFFKGGDFSTINFGFQKVGMGVGVVIPLLFWIFKGRVWSTLKMRYVYPILSKFLTKERTPF
jgi:hypothetical protein